MKLLTFLFFSLIAFWLIGLIFRASVNRWLRKRTEEYNRAAGQARKEAQRRARGTREGDVVVETPRATVEKKVRRDVGDYVEFEEITEVTEEQTVEKEKETR